ncbi:MAG: beta-galactosidase, partial [Thermicanus sp.]|nr:beta-galactosidase [Thermicanus sp.]
YYIGNIVHENYPDIVIANAFTKAIQPEEQPLFSAEFQGGFQMGKPRLQPTTFDLTTRLCIANGMNAINFYMFAGGENYEQIGMMGKRHDWQAPVSTDGSLKPHYYVIRDLRNVIRAIEKELLASRKEVTTYLGFYPDYFMTENIREPTKEMFRTLIRFREAYLYNGIGRGLVLQNIPFEGYDLLKESEIDPQEIPSLWVLSAPWMGTDVQEKLIRYVEMGGKLILFPSLPQMDMTGKPCRKIADWLGVEEVQRHQDPFAEIDGIESVHVSYMEVYTGKDLIGFASPESEHEPSRNVSAFEKEMGKGKVILFGMGLELDQTYKEEVVLKLARRMGIMTASRKTDYLDISFRRIPNSETAFLFIQNFDEYAKEMVYDHFGQPLFDGLPIRIEARSGLILPLHLKVNGETEVIYSTCELVGRHRGEIEFKLRQPIEAIKWNRRVEILSCWIEHEWKEEEGAYLLLLKNSPYPIVRFKV